MRLLVVTDHKYYGTPDGVYDTYCFDRSFFDDYRAAFEEVHVMARLREGSLPRGARRSDGDGVDFMALPDWGGFKWMFGLPLRYRKRIAKAVREADAVCVRLPSVSGDVAFQAAQRQGKPVMFELIGDPEASLAAGQHGLMASLIGRLNARRVRVITNDAVCGSYVSRAHLQEAYPPGPGTTHDSISSIRLPDGDIAPPRVFVTTPAPLRLVLTASLVPVKSHDVLLRAIAEATDKGASLHLALIGNGSQRLVLEQLATKLNIIGRVTFHGHLADRAHINFILDNSDLFVMTSASEGMPRSMIEAMARGLPAIGSNVGGIAEILSDEQQFEAGNWHALSELLMKVNETRLNRWAQHSHATALQFEQGILSGKRRRLLTLLREAAS